MEAKGPPGTSASSSRNAVKAWNCQDTERGTELGQSDPNVRTIPKAANLTLRELAMGKEIADLIERLQISELQAWRMVNDRRRLLRDGNRR